MPIPVRAVITGGPGAGKSSLLEALGRRGLATESEAARAILREPAGMELRAQNPAAFAMAMFEAELAAYHSTRGRTVTTVFDRGFPDIAGFLRVEALQVPAKIDRACRELRYDGPVFRAPPWRAIYRSDSERIQNWEEAVASDTAVVGAWREYGYEPIDLPLASVEERADFIMLKLA